MENVEWKEERKKRNKLRTENEKPIKRHKLKCTCALIQGAVMRCARVAALSRSHLVQPEHNEIVRPIWTFERNSCDQRENQGTQANERHKNKANFYAIEMKVCEYIGKRFVVWTLVCVPKWVGKHRLCGKSWNVQRNRQFPVPVPVCECVFFFAFLFFCPILLHRIFSLVSFSIV